MEARRYFPNAPLSAFVDCLWYSEGAPQTHSKEKLLPNGAPAIIFNLRDDAIRIYDAQDIRRFSTYGQAMYSGARSNCFVIDSGQQDRVAGIQFRPGGSYPFLPVPAWEAENLSIQLEDLWPKRAGEIRERLLAVRSVDGIFHVLEHYLLAQLRRAPERHPAVAYALRQFDASAHCQRVTEVYRSIGLSARRFIELFRREVGLAPKVFCRVRRFQRVLHAIHLQREVDWAQVALECGYYDQPHFIHDFQCFSGLTPNAYLRSATPHLNHVPLG